MKYIKEYSNYSDVIEIGEYVICSESIPDLDDFLENNIGKYIGDVTDGTLVCPYKYIIEYRNVPISLLTYFHFEQNTEYKCRRESMRDIVYHSKNIEDLEAILAAKKYNI